MTDNLKTKRPFSGPSSTNYADDSERKRTYENMESEHMDSELSLVDDPERKWTSDNLDADHVDTEHSLTDDLERKRTYDNLDSDHVENVKRFICGQCNVTFSRMGNLRKHERNIHSIDNTKCTQICGVCNAKTRTIVDLHKHIENQHPDLKLCFNQKMFYCQSDFDQWKIEIERQSVSSFILASTKVYDHSEVYYYKCHRSGFYRPRACETSTGQKRHSKYAGTIKTGISCPAMIKATKETFYEATQITVEYQSTHVGHKCEVGKLQLQKKERVELACMLKSGVPINVVMDRTQAQYSPTKRLGITTRQDIYNVIRDFNVNSVVHKDDAMAVDIMVKKMMKEKYNSVLIYKPVGEKLLNYPLIDDEEFLLGICTEAQLELLNLLGKDCVMLDSTHGTNQYGFQLTTALVHDANHEGLPVAIFFSKRIAAETFQPFFDAIKLKISDFETDILMTDDTNSFLNAWNRSFQKEPRHLLCSWHVMKNINKNLNSKVKDEEVRENMKKELKKLVHELDVVTFKNYLQSFLVAFEIEKEFIDYFKDHYVFRQEKWAYCYRKGLKVNTNMKIERWHRQIKYEEAGGVVMKRLDKSLNLILKAVAKKLMNRIVSIERGKLTKRIKLIRKRHADSENMDESVYSIVKMNDTLFIVSKLEDQDIFTYDVEVENLSCGCTTACVDCNICIHSMSCTCIDYNIRFVICKHIHFVCRKYNIVCGPSAIPASASSEEGCLFIDVSEDEISKSTEKNIILKQIIQPKKNLSEKKAAIEQAWKDISSKIQASESSEDLEFVADNLKYIQSYFGIANKSEFPSFPSNTATPSNKNICPQRKFKIPPKKKQKK